MVRARIKKLGRFLFPVTLIAGSLALAAGIDSAQSTGVILPDWVWASLITGALSGAVTYGAIRIKFEWLFSRIKTIEDSHKEDFAAITKRIDRLMHSRRTDDHKDD